MYTAEQQVIIYQLAKYEKDPMKNGREIAERRWWERNKKNKNKETTIQQQKGLPTLSADLNKAGQYINCLYFKIFIKCVSNGTFSFILDVSYHKILR